MSAFRVGRKPVPSSVQRAWLRCGLDEPGGKLPLFDEFGRQIDPRTVQACIEQGWAEPWFKNPLKPDWLVCKLTPAGRNWARRAAPAAKLIHATRELDKANV